VIARKSRSQNVWAAPSASARGARTEICNNELTFNLVEEVSILRFSLFSFSSSSGSFCDEFPLVASGRARRSDLGVAAAGFYRWPLSLLPSSLLPFSIAVLSYLAISLSLGSSFIPTLLSCPSPSLCALSTVYSLFIDTADKAQKGC
jgi:hypothetical protein